MRFLQLVSSCLHLYFELCDSTFTCLTGADQVTLDGVYHSPLGAVIAVDGKVGRPWYGSPEILPQWIRHIDCDESQNVVEVGSTLPPDMAFDSRAN